MIWSKCPGHVKSDGPGGLNVCPICNPAPTIASDALALRRALANLGWTIADALRLPRLVAWLSR